jgi:hypothetical protein
MWRSLILAAALLVLAGCGAGGSTVAERDTGPAEELKLYETDTTVLEQGEGMALPAHGPQLCLGGIAASDPPQCGGLPIANWDWDAVDGEETKAGTTFGVFHVVGTYDGKSFTVTETGPPRPLEDTFDESQFDSLCEPPPEGWDVAAFSDDTDAMNEYVQAQPDYVRSWVSYLKKPTEDVEDPGPFIFNVVFTGDAAKHETAIRDLWSGPLCVAAQDVPSERELAAIRAEVEGELEGMGLVLVESWTEQGMIQIGVVLDEGGAAQALFDERYGPGVVNITSELQPVRE